ncbi:MAG: hypothetical protein KAR43_13985 [Deltaproteobacteria bacterium]|nr:hypothetical protein [Deltaproteobacteria bacterium]
MKKNVNYIKDLFNNCFMDFEQSIPAILLLTAMFFISSVEVRAYTSNNTSIKSGDYKIGDARLRTPPNADEPTKVYVSFYLQDVDEINDQLETFHLVGFINLKWYDPRQSFDPEKIGVTEIIYQGNYQFNELSPAWYPQVILANESGLYEKHSVLLRVKPDGTSILVETVNAVAEADLSLRRCPFDSQLLEAVFEVLGFDTSEVVIEAEPVPPLTDSQRIRTPQWILKNLNFSIREHTVPYAGSQGTSSSFVLTIDVQRQSFFMLRLVVVPLLLIVGLSWFVFWMDRSSLGDRISISFIGILTAVAFQTVVSEILPKISYITLIHGFINISFFFMCGTAIINLVVGWLDKRGDFKRGDLIDYRCRKIVPIAYFGVLSVTVAIAFVFF